MAEKEWIFDKGYNSWFYLKSSGTYAAREWIGLLLPPSPVVTWLRVNGLTTATTMPVTI